MEAWQSNAAWALGVGIQFLRSLRGVPDWCSGLVLVVASVVLFWLGPDVPPISTKEFWRSFVMWCPALFATGAGGTFLTSLAAHKLRDMGVAKDTNPLLPVTNSK